MQKTVSESARTLPVLEECDVLVVGGGPAGMAAAIGAARAGAKTIVVERYGCLGGSLTTASMETPGWRPDEAAVLPGGVFGELDARMVRAGLCQTTVRGHAYDTEALKYVADDLVGESGAASILHCLGVAPLIEGGVIVGVVTESKSGRQAILARRVVDCTGDGDIAARAGASCVMPEDPAEGTLAYGLRNVDPERLPDSAGLRPDFAFNRIHGSTITAIDQVRVEVDGTDVRSITAAEIAGRKAIVEGIPILRQSCPGLENARLRNFAMGVGIRETRRIAGEYVLTGQDVAGGRAFDDTVGVCPGPCDGYFQTPFRVTVPVGVENLLVAGRCVSAERGGSGVPHTVSFAMLTGQAAGIASALSLRDGVASRQTDIPTLQTELIRQGVRIR